MVTSKQRAANQQNARHSTGPKSEAGKRAASLNAIRHGLTSQTAINALNPNLALLSHLIREEVGDELLAQTIAAKVLDYERTEAYQLDVAARESAGKDGYVNEDALAKARNEGRATALWSGQVDGQLAQKGLAKNWKNELKVYKESLEFLTKMSLRQERMLQAEGQEAFERLRRYFKRASNQLIKAVKAAGSA